MLDANPHLTWRQVRYILAHSANNNLDPEHKVGLNQAQILNPDEEFSTRSSHLVIEPGWVENAAGLKFSNYYGFGVVDAAAAVAMSLNPAQFPATMSAQTVDFTDLEDEQGNFLEADQGRLIIHELPLIAKDRYFFESDPNLPNAAKIDMPSLLSVFDDVVNDGLGSSKAEFFNLIYKDGLGTFSASLLNLGTVEFAANPHIANPKLEGVQMHLVADIDNASKMFIRLTSPRGTTSVLWHPYADFSKHSGPLEMKLYSNAFFGEDPRGTWYLEAYSVDQQGAVITMQDALGGAADLDLVSGLRFYYGNYDHPPASIANIP